MIYPKSVYIKNTKLLEQELVDSIYPWYNYSHENYLIYFCGWVDAFQHREFNNDCYMFIKNTTENYLKNKKCNIDNEEYHD